MDHVSATILINSNLLLCCLQQQFLHNVSISSMFCWFPSSSVELEQSDISLVIDSLKHLPFSRSNQIDNSTFYGYVQFIPNVDKSNTSSEHMWKIFRFNITQLTQWFYLISIEFMSVSLQGICPCYHTCFNYAFSNIQYQRWFYSSINAMWISYSQVVF